MIVPDFFFFLICRALQLNLTKNLELFIARMCVIVIKLTVCNSVYINVCLNITDVHCDVRMSEYLCITIVVTFSLNLFCTVVF